MSHPYPAGGIRLPAFSKGNRDTQVGSTHHFTGGLVLGDGPGGDGPERRMGQESNLERKATLILHARPETVSLVEQVLFKWINPNNAPGKQLVPHWIDLVQTQANGQVIGYAVRPTAHAGPEYQLKLARIKTQAVAQGVLDDLRLFTEEDVCPVEWHNARQFLAVRRPDLFADPVAADVVGRMTGVCTLDDLVSATGLEGMGFRALVRLIRSGHLEMVRHERIAHTSQVFKAKEF
ncbi:hypothetical protein [Pseudophaeobacter sp. TrK17]|uniref:hypothetical protein n=1 Tax=Pseudophaeobacter sp. TrK17 TaxID=2815167 RepID=UPI0035CF8C29